VLVRAGAAAECGPDRGPVVRAAHSWSSREEPAASQSERSALPQRWQHNEKPLRGHRSSWMCSSSEFRGLASELYQFMAIDDCTRIRLPGCSTRVNREPPVHRRSAALTVSNPTFRRQRRRVSVSLACGMARHPPCRHSSQHALSTPGHDLTR